VVLARHEQRMTREQRAVVEEGDRALILEDQMRGLRTGDDLTETAVRVPGGQTAIVSEQGEEI